MSALTYAMDATTYLTAGLVDAGHVDIMLESAILKVFASDSLWQIFYDTMQIFGGRSFFTEYSIRADDARCAPEYDRGRIQRGPSGLYRLCRHAQRRRRCAAVAQSSEVTMESPQGLSHRCKEALRSGCFLPKVPVVSKELTREADALSQAVRRFGMAVLKVLKRYREEVVEKQLDLESITNCAIALYTMTAVIGKMDSALQSDKSDPNEIATRKTLLPHGHRQHLMRTSSVVFSGRQTDRRPLRQNHRSQFPWLNDR